MEVVRQVGAGLQALHDRDILHRDIKPANVLFRTVDGAEDHGVRAMVGDLGLEKALDMTSRLTMVAGTPTYVAPEQAAAEAPDARADQYSLAALAFLLLTGRPPFTHASLSDAMNPSTLPPVSTPERPFPPAVEQVLRRGLARDRDDRYPTSPSSSTRWRRRSVRSPPGRPPSRGSTATPSYPARAATHRATRLGRPARAGAAAPARPSARGARAGRARRAGPRRGSRVRRSAPARPDRAHRHRRTRHLSVTVPTAWDRADARDGWKPPNADGDLPALSVGTSTDWATQEGNGEGVFVALLPGTELPEQLPQHPECEIAGRAIETARTGTTRDTVVYADCPGGGVIAERVVQVTTNTLLWVQIRSDDRAAANQVLDDVHTHGI